MKRWVAVLAALAMGVTFSACDDLNDNGVEFRNESSHEVGVFPDGDHDWDAFRLEPGEHETVDVSHTVHFYYTPADEVDVDKSEDHTIIFVNE